MTSAFNLFDHFAVNEDKEVKGVWVYPLGDAEGAPAFLVARTGGANKDYTLAAAKAMKPYGPTIQKGAHNLDPATLELIKRLNFTVFVEHIVKDWKNITNAQNETLPFSKANATEILTALPELYEKLFAEASDISNFRPDAGADAKN